MKQHKSISVLFIIGAAYDGILGLAFLFSPLAVFALYSVTPPNHAGYVQFPAALLIVFSLMFLNIARNPEQNRNLIPYGILLKVSYCSVVFWYWFSEGIPGMWKPFAVFDICFAALFIWAYTSLRKKTRQN